MSLDKIYNSEGYCDLLFVNGGPNYQYYRKDHLGNNREVWNANGNVTYQRTQYYPSGLPWADSQGSWIQNKKYNGKEFIEAHGLDEYDSSARWYYPAIMRTTTLDPLAEKYYSISPYAWCGNNPVRMVDPTGMVVEDPDNIYKDQKDQITKNLSTVQQLLSGTGLSEGMTKALNALVGMYNEILNEYSALETSDQIYSVFNEGGKEGGTYYEKGKVMIAIGDKSIGIVGHELKHAYQFEIGEVSFKTDGKGFGSLYDISDETSAYNRERFLSTGIGYINNPDQVYQGYPLKMNDENVRDFGKNKMNPPAYQSLPNGPIDVNSLEGQRIQKSSFLQGLTGASASTEVCRGLYYMRGFNTLKKK